MMAPPDRDHFDVIRSLLQNRVVKRGDAPGALILHQHSDAQFMVRGQRLPIRTDEATELIGDVGERDVRPDEIAPPH